MHATAVIRACNELNEGALSTNLLRNKFDPRRYVNRLSAEANYKSFLRSDKPLFLILGESGTGKTNLMCHLAKEHRESQATLLVTNVALARGDDLVEQVLRPLAEKLGLDSDNARSWLSMLSNCLLESDRQLLILIDGINEFEDRERVKKALLYWLDQAPTNVRLVLSCRTDSFRAAFADAHWRQYMYIVKPPPDTRPVESESLRIVPEKYLRRFAQHVSPKQDAEIRTAMLEYEKAVARKKLELRRRSLIESSILLGSFNEVEFLAALRKYGIKARLIGRAREDCHDPFVFRLFSDTYGQMQQEITNIFGVSSCRDYLDRCISTLDRGEALQLLFSAADRCKHSRSCEIDSIVELGGVLSTPCSFAQFTPQLEVLVDSKLLSWGKMQASGIPESFSFSFDRMLSFVFALKVSNEGASAIREYLKEAIEKPVLSDIEIHAVRYILLLLEESEFTEFSPELEQWVDRLLSRQQDRWDFIELLTELTTVPHDTIIRKIDSILSGLQVSRSMWRHRSDSEDTFVTFDDDVSFENRDADRVVLACSRVLAEIIRNGGTSLALDFLREFLNRYSSFERRKLFYWLIDPLAVASASHPIESLSLIESLCDLADVGRSRINSDDVFYEPSDLLETDFLSPDTTRVSTGIEALGYEIANFPESRMPIIRELAKSSEPIMRIITTKALPNLSIINPEEADRLFRALAKDIDSSVRAGLSMVLAEVYSNDLTTALAFTRELWEDKDSAVRSMLVTSIMKLFVEGVEKLADIVKGLYVDESPAV